MAHFWSSASLGGYNGIALQIYTYILQNKEKPKPKKKERDNERERNDGYLVFLGDRRKLKEVSANDELDAAKRILIVSTKDQYNYIEMEKWIQKRKRLIKKLNQIRYWRRTQT